MHTGSTSKPSSKSDTIRAVSSGVHCTGALAFFLAAFFLAATGYAPEMRNPGAVRPQGLYEQQATKLM